MVTLFKYIRIKRPTQFYYERKIKYFKETMTIPLIGELENWVVVLVIH